MAGKHRAPKRRTARVVETEEYAAFLARAMDAMMERCAADPAGLAHYKGLIQRMTDGMNWAIARAKDGPDGYSLTELGAIMGISGPAVQQRVNRGRGLIIAAEDSAGVTRLRDALGRPSVPVLRAEREETLRSAGIEDRRRRTA